VENPSQQHKILKLRKVIPSERETSSIHNNS